jgi:predicted SAM-dependent methyltransferase
MSLSKENSPINLDSLSIFDKLNFYRKKYGLPHALLGYLGRYNLRFWMLIGSIVTKQYKQHYLATHTPKILNLGGGGNCLKDCLTADITPRADIYVDITKKLPFDNNSVDYIFCEEAIEHINLNDGIGLLKECLRILKEGGIIRIATPDLDWFASQLSQSVEACNEINEIFYEHDHRYLYTKKTLRYFVEQAGFINLIQSSYKDNNSQLGYLDSHADRFNHSPDISQYLEMQKPIKEHENKQNFR